MLSPCKDPQKLLDCIKSMRTSGNCVVSPGLAFPTPNREQASIISWASHRTSMWPSCSGDDEMKVRRAVNKRWVVGGEKR